MSASKPHVHTVKLKGRWLGNPWVFRSMVSASRSVPVGAVVKVEERGGRHVGWGLWNSNTPVVLRILTTDPDFPGPKWIREKLQVARKLRRDLLGKTKAHRLVHGEGDGLPGLIVDVFEGAVVIEPVAAGWINLMDWVVESLRKVYPKVPVGVRPDARSSEREQVDFETLGKKFKVPASAKATELGVTFGINLKLGHKTGFFLDQRANRAAVAELAKGRKMVDLCCYSGGFALTAARAGAKVIGAIDLDEKALVVANENAGRNRLDVDFTHANAFDWLRQAKADNLAPEMMVLDPPKFVMGKKDQGKGLRSYADLNRLAIDAMAPGGYLLTCSCSGAVSEDEFLKVVVQAAGRAGRDLQIVKITGADVDHPVAGGFPEGRYLKAVLARVL